MKRKILTITLLLAGMAILISNANAQDLSYFKDDYMRTDSTFTDRLAVLEVLRQTGIQASGEFYHEALNYLLLKSPDINSRNEQEAAEKSVVILAQALGSLKYTEAAGDLWRAAEFYDVAREGSREPNEGNAFQAVVIALADIDARDFIPHIVYRLTVYNAQIYNNAETRRRVSTAVIGCIRALETFKDIAGYREVFFVYTGKWDLMIRQIAENALSAITDDPGDVIIGIIRDPSVDPPVKLVAWREMLKTKAPNESKAKVAAAALDVGWTYATANKSFQANLRELRRGAIDIIRQYGADDETVYANLEKSYLTNYLSNTGDNDEIVVTLNALAALRTQESIDLLYQFLSDLNIKRRTGPWRAKERQHFQWIISCLGVTGTRDVKVILLLRTIERDDKYTTTERSWAKNALSALGQ